MLDYIFNKVAGLQDLKVSGLWDSNAGVFLRNTSGLVMSSGGKERDQWHEIS